MEKVKKLIEAGLPISAAIKAALGMPLSEFAEKYGIAVGSFTNHVNGIVRATDPTIDALASEMGGTDEEWRELLWQAMRPAHLAAASWPAKESAQAGKPAEAAPIARAS